VVEGARGEPVTKGRFFAEHRSHAPSGDLSLPRRPRVPLATASPPTKARNLTRLHRDSYGPQPRRGAGFESRRPTGSTCVKCPCCHGTSPRMKRVWRRLGRQSRTSFTDLRPLTFISFTSFRPLRQRPFLRCGSRLSSHISSNTVHRLEPPPPPWASTSSHRSLRRPPSDPSRQMAAPS
jgi:hypothetical protein